ncbi:MAG: response regulator RpfG family c-di-GMP phosphodiesterase [Polyangiales bacterium]|jgi:response regulator RpfG family c-di-GMP phosphodiesterase
MGDEKNELGMRLLERLRAEDIVSAEIFRSVVIEARRLDEHAVETLLRMGAIDEATLLKRIASLYKTRFVSTEKLSRADVQSDTIRMVPRRMCTRFQCFPIRYDPKAQTLLVVASDMESYDVAMELQSVTTIRRIDVLAARFAAVEAAIAKHYDGKSTAFDHLVSESTQQGSSSGGFSPSFGGFGNDFGADSDGGAMLALAGSPKSSSSSSAGSPASSEALDLGTVDIPMPSPSDEPFRIEAPEVSEGLTSENARAPSMSPPAPADGQAFLDMVHVFVALLDREREGLRDHGAEVARLCRGVCGRLGIQGSRADAIILAGYLHDVGKTSSYHLTPFNAARYDGHRAQAKKTYLAPSRLFASANLPTTTTKALAHLYERYDGSGFPDSLSGKEIPLGSRIVAIAETYADLTSHGKNPYRRRLNETEGCEALQGLSGTVFDPEMVELVRQVVQGRSSASSGSKTVLLVDPDPDETTILDIRLAAAGFLVEIARDAKRALAIIEEGRIDAMVSEVALDGVDGFELAEKIRKQGRTLPILYLTSKGDRTSVERGFKLGAVDYLVKPASPEVVVAKMKKMFSGASRGISGSLTEMSLPDVLQIVGNSRKTGRLIITSAGRRGEIHLSEGQVWDARFSGARAQEAFYRLLILNDGGFEFDSSFAPTARLIDDQLESLLLEGMRRLDEACEIPGVV